MSGHAALPHRAGVLLKPPWTYSSLMNNDAGAVVYLLALKQDQAYLVGPLTRPPSLSALPLFLSSLYLSHSLSLALSLSHPGQSILCLSLFIWSGQGVAWVCVCGVYGWGIVASGVF